MTPKEKAKELVSKFEDLVDDCADSVYDACGHKAGKGCALICVDAIIEALQFEGLSGGYWQEVKQELNIAK
jgi:hypothetical protein